ncbi:hypothetical protein L917_18895 [Phytophthora nicotianae]|uniref:RxLR effector PexRD54 WY domain-containing protein n=1 Tax=Phytophthora nicotianae TaxID=4792 RepID=W2K6A4_PHYNI|nr:hypothetical protein L917_18895 [Phytophthora nicotianae]
MATPDILAFADPYTEALHDVPGVRLLRAHKLTDNEERTTGAAAIESMVKSTITTEQLEAWLKRGDTVDDVFKALHLQKAGDALLDNPQLCVLINYMNRFNTANPTKKTNVVAALTAHYGDQRLTKIIEAATKSPTSSKMAKHFQTEQVQRWLTDKKTPEDVFGLLKLNKFWPLSWISSDLFNKPGLTTWIRYLDDFNEANPEQKTTLLSILSARYSDKTLVNMLIEANNVRSTSTIAKRIQAEQTRFWLDNKVAPADIFKTLNLNKAGDNIFENPLFSAWINYADDFHLMHSDTQLATMPTLLTHYNDRKLSSMIMAAVEIPSTKTLAERVQSELTNKLLENPLFPVWTKYVAYYNSMNFKTKYDLIATLTYYYGGDRELTKMLMAAVKEPNTNKLATELQDLQIARWISKKFSPAQVSTFLGADNASSILYKRYVATYNGQY